MNCTIFKDIFSQEPRYITIDTALERIKNGRSKERVTEIREALDKEKADYIKRSLPSVCFSGVFSPTREDANLKEHSGFIVLDFDNLDEPAEKMAELSLQPWVYAAWLSPRGNGVKGLVRIADGSKHRLHFAALKEFFPGIDDSGVNESRVCFESYDPYIYINKEATAFTRTLEPKKVMEKSVVGDERTIFSNILKWLTNKGGVFAKGDRNNYIFKLASACCRFGIDEDAAVSLISGEYPPSNDFSYSEMVQTIKSAYKRNKAHSAVFERETLIDTVTRKEISLEQNEEIDPDAPAKDVIFGQHVKANAMRIYSHGYESVKGVGIPELDDLFKCKRGELTCLSGFGNAGKSSWYRWYVLMRILCYGEKFASFSPEDFPPEEYYHDFVEILLGTDCAKLKKNGQVNTERPDQHIYENAYDFISQHIFYMYPKDSAPTPSYIKERFLELIIKEKVDGICVDPFNQMSHQYGAERGDQYLEKILGEFSRFAQNNNVYSFIIAHPTKMPKEANGNYSCPDVFDITGGSMWNNKMDNILIYHRPIMQTNPEDPLCELHTKKIKRQKIVGMRGRMDMAYVRRTRRFEVNGMDGIAEMINYQGLDFEKPVFNYTPKSLENFIQNKRENITFASPMAGINPKTPF